MICKFHHIFIILLCITIFSSGQDELNSVEESGVKMTVYRTIPAYYMNEFCREGQTIASLVKIENKRKGDVLTVSPYNFEFKNIKTGMTYKPSVMGEGCKLYGDNKFLTVLKGTIEYGESAKGWIPFNVPYGSGLTNAEDIEIRYVLNVFGEVLILKWRWADYEAAKKEQKEIERAEAEKKKSTDRINKMREFTANFIRFKENGLIDSAVEESFRVLNFIVYDIGSKTLEQSDETAKKIVKSLFEETLTFLVNTAKNYYQKAEYKKFELIYLRMLEKSLLEDNITIDNILKKEMNKGAVVYGKYLYEKSIQGFLEFYEKAAQKGNLPLEIKQLAALLYEKMGDSCYSNNDFEKAIVNYNSSQVAGGKVGDKMVTIYGKLGDKYFSQKAFDKALNQYNLVKQGGGKVDVKLASTCFSLGKQDEALNLFQSALSNPDYKNEQGEIKQGIVSIYVSKAKSDYEAASYNNARMHCQKALEYQPDNAEAMKIMKKIDSLKRSPVVASFCSIIPGGGQFYNRESLQGLKNLGIGLGLYGGGVLMGLWGNAIYEDYQNATTSEAATSLYDQANTKALIGWGLIGCGVVWSIYSGVTAVTSVKKYNKKFEVTIIPKYDINCRKLCLYMQLNINKRRQNNEVVN